MKDKRILYDLITEKNLYINLGEKYIFGALFMHID